MKDRTKVEDVAMTIVPMITATMSLVASVAIIASIRRSKKKLKDAYRRIVFGMSVFDIISSLAGALVIFQSTPESNTWLPLGNQTSCDILTFIRFVGIVGAAQYTVSLNIYYYYIIKQNMREEVFRKKIEPWIHGLPMVWSFSVGIYTWVVEAFNPSLIGVCVIGEYPLNCSKNDDVECIRGQKYLAPLIFLMLTIVLCLVISMLLLILIWCKVRRQEVRMDRYRIRSISFHMNESLNGRTGGGRDEQGFCREMISNALMEVRDWYRRFQRNRRTPSNSRTFLHSAFWYTLAFLVTFTFTFVVIIRTKMGFETSFLLQLLARSMQPLQGLFNILAYTRPHVKVCRQINPEWTWFQAFRHIIASGGDDDQDPNERRRRSSAMSRRRRCTSSSYSSLRSVTGSEYHGRHRSSLGASTGDNAPPRVTSMFGPVRRRSSRGDMFHADINEDEVRTEIAITRANGSDVSEPDEESDPSPPVSRRRDSTRLSMMLDDADIDIDDDSIELGEDTGRDDKADIVLAVEDESRRRIVRFAADHIKSEDDDNEDVVDDH